MKIIDDNLEHLYELNEKYISDYNKSFLSFEPDQSSKKFKTPLDDFKNTYSVDKLFLRNKKDFIFGNPADILTLGCSQTYGVGLPDEQVWPEILSKQSGMSVYNFGMSGASAKIMMESMMFYFKKVGIPKYVVAVFPDFYRYTHVVDSIFFTARENQQRFFTELPAVITTFIETSFYDTGIIKLDNKYIRLPVNPKFIIPPQESIKQYFSSILMIQAICDLLNIKFYWGTWQGLANEVINKFTKEYSGSEINLDRYIATFSHFVDPSKCNVNHKEFIKTIDKSMWQTAADKSHLGIHWHLHISDEIFKKIQKDQIGFTRYI